MKVPISCCRPLLYLAAALLVCGPATAQYAADFEQPTFTGSADGTVMTGQDGFYIPPDTDSVDYLVFTYADNALGFSEHPGGGGAQFVAGTGPANNVYARAQRDFDWAPGLVEVTYDVAALWLMQDPNSLPANNLGSFSHQPSTASDGVQIHLFSWEEGFEGELWQALYVHYNAAGGQVAQPGSSPGPEWENLELNHWYRFSTLVDFDLNEIVSVSITDLSTGASATVDTTEYYLSGGLGGGPPTVTAFRFFAGGLNPGNTVAWDNFGIGPPGTDCVADLDGDGDTDLADLAELLGDYGCSGGGCTGDFDADGDTDLADLAFLLGDYGCMP